MEIPRVEKSVNNEEKDREKRADVFLRFLDNAKNIDALRGKKVEEIFSNIYKR